MKNNELQSSFSHRVSPEVKFHCCKNVFTGNYSNCKCFRRNYTVILVKTTDASNGDFGRISNVEYSGEK